ncbi:MAG: hypothetical protein IJV24_07135 [Prevotella sp.]|nr:hypothetical protein [Prevotella sp.]
MNRLISQTNAAFRNAPIDMVAMARTQRNNKRTAINRADVDFGRTVELTQMLTEDTDLGMMVRPLPYAEIAGDTVATLNVVMQALGLYTFPTQELVDWLRSEIDDDPDYEPHTAIEICCGTGWLGRSLGIPTTDSRLQERDDIRQSYLAQGAMPISYPKDVEPLDALSAIRKYEPEYVVASYCTHLYGTGSLKSGNAFGVDTRWVRSHCRRFYHIGNDDIHHRDPIQKMPHRRLQFPWLVTRGNSAHARIYVWENRSY